MINEVWEELKARATSTILLSLTPKIKYNVLNEKSPSNLWEKLKKSISQNPLQIGYI